MGIRGLSTYIFSKKELFMSDYEIPHDSILVVDGYSLVMGIYTHTFQNRNACFGGDYKTYAEAVKNFLNMFLECKIIPYVLFDGSTEGRKLETVLNRLKERIIRSSELNCTEDPENLQNAIYPLLVGSVFKNVLKQMNIPMVICDFECDGEIANIARQLDCPVLSFDSDFFIFDVKYIPIFSDIESDQLNFYVYSKLEMDKETNVKKLNRYLRCKIFNRNSFLLSSRLTIDMLPVLTIYLGNDFIHRVNNVALFYEYLNIRGQMKGVHFVETMIRYLTGKKPTEAIEIMVNYYVDAERTMVQNLILETLDGYQLFKSKYLRYLENNEENNNLVHREIVEDCEYLQGISKIFLEKFRKGFYRTHSMNIFLLHKYFPPTLVEATEKSHCHTSSFPIISIIHKCLTNNAKENLLFYGRCGTKLCEQIVPECNKYVPSYQELQEMDLKRRFHIFHDILDIEQEFITDCLEKFPVSWHIFLITLKYMSTVACVDWCFIKSLLLCKIMISCCDNKLGLIRSEKHFEKYALQNIPHDKNSKSRRMFSQKLAEISSSDSVSAIRELLPYYKVSDEMKINPELFDRSLIHSMSEFQSCFVHIDMLNDIFNRPYEKCPISEIYEGTFIYNIFSELRQDSNLITCLLENSTSLLHCFNSMINLLTPHFKIS